MNAELSPFRERLQRRGAAILLTLLIEGLLVVMLLGLVVLEPAAKLETVARLTSFSLSPAAQTDKADKAEAKPEAERPTPAEEVAPPEIPIPPSPNKGFIEMSREEMAASDISTLPQYESAAASGAAQAILPKHRGRRQMVSRFIAQNGSASRPMGNLLFIYRKTARPVVGPSSRAARLKIIKLKIANRLANLLRVRGSRGLCAKQPGNSVFARRASVTSRLSVPG